MKMQGRLLEWKVVANALENPSTSLNIERNEVLVLERQSVSRRPDGLNASIWMASLFSPPSCSI
jgi:hypothetical protein